MKLYTEEIKKELEELAPLLAAIDKPNDTALPTDYFENLPDEIWNKVKPEIRSKNSIARIIPYKWIGLAASILLLIAVFNIDSNQDSTQHVDVPVELFVDYLIEDIDDLDLDFIIELESITQEEMMIDEDELNYLLESDLQDIDDINFEPFINTL